MNVTMTLCPNENFVSGAQRRRFGNTILTPNDTCHIILLSIYDRLFEKKFSVVKSLYSTSLDDDSLFTKINEFQSISIILGSLLDLFCV